jgi:hypothetical protein
MPVRQLRVGQATHRRGPRPVGGDMITTDAQHLGLPLLELAVEAPEEDGLLGSPRGEIEHMK